MSTVATGLDVFQDGYWRKLRGYGLGLLSNQASVDSTLKSAKEIISGLLPGQLRALFGPQHGYWGIDQENMIETEHSHDRDLDIPLYSLYSETREPLPEMLDLIDILIIDLQDVGSRVYTFASTLLNCLKAASKSGKKVIVLDRPNPLGGEMVEGNLLKPELHSFVGPFPLPMRHGLTMGEMAEIFNRRSRIAADLEIVPMKGWNRNMIWQDTGLKWVMPSPNMPLPETAQVYPGQVMWEGTNLSEGRGTCRPFEIFGAPFLDTGLIKQSLPPEARAGCLLQEILFRPTFHKWEGEVCRGFMIHILDQRLYHPYFSSMVLLKAVLELHEEQFAWRKPPYEYEYEKMPVDVILGDSSLKIKMEKGADLFEIKERWVKELKDFLEWRKSYLLYS
ncbi:MAG: DUF1343 domain-containing protein [Deltaproteobacteria bacterium]|nr:MAG: DUF1343 domain-containing protein [Deltaproteobacteria bacterium]